MQEFLTQLKSRWLFSAVVSALLGVTVFLVAYILPGPTWEAAGVIRVGQGPDGNSYNPQLVMQLDETEQFLRSGGEALLGEEGSFRIRQVSSTMIDLRVTASSAERAGQIYSEMLSELKFTHDAIYAERMGFWQAHADDLSRIGEIAREIQRRTNGMCREVDQSDEQNLFLCATFMAAEGARLDRLLMAANELAMLRRKLQPSWSFPTIMIGAMAVKPVETSLTLSIVLAVLAALASFVLVTLFTVLYARLERIDSQ